MDCDLLFQEISRIQKKMIMKNDIWEIKDTKFFLPLYPVDFIARDIVDENHYFEEDILEDLNRFIPENSVICDVGANIGNHSLYWAIRKKARRIYSFEPVKSTFEILLKNIQINNLGEVIMAYNCGLSDERGRANKKTYRLANIGDTHLEKKVDGDIELVSLDEMKIDNCIDFLKIDVEDFEENVLKGAQETIKRDKPVIFLESYPECFENADAILTELGYHKEIDYPHHNYLYMPDMNKRV